MCAQQNLQLHGKVSALLGSSDEIDAIATKRETAQREMERRIVAQMLTCMDDLSAPAPSAQTDTQADAAAVATAGQASSDAQQTDGQTPSKHVVIIGEACHHDLSDQGHGT